MAFPDDPRDLKVGFAFGHTDAEDPTGLTYEVVSPNEDDDTDPGPVLDTVTITRGRVGDAATTGTTRIETSVRNTDGEFSPRNVSGPHYGELRMGTPMQVAVDIGAGDVVLARAAVPDWNPRWDGPDINDRLPIGALGALARLGRDQAVYSALRLFIPIDTLIVAYWPMEDLAGDRFGSAIPGQPALTLTGDVSGSDGSLPGSGALLVFAGDTTLDGSMAAQFPGGEWSVFWIGKYPTAPGSATTLLEVRTGGGSAVRWVLSADATNMILTGFDEAGASAFSASSPTNHGFWFSDEWMAIVLTVGTGGTIFSVDATRVDNPSVVGVVGGSSALTAGVVATLRVPASAGLDGSAFGHLAVYNDSISPFGFASVAAGNEGDSARGRFFSLTALLGIPANSTSGTSAIMGAQHPGTLLSLLRECEAADHGVLLERRDGRLGFDRRVERYNVAVALALEYGTEAEPGDVTDLAQFDDDRDLYNIVTVKRRDGIEATAEQATGPVGSDDTTGVGPRRLPVTLNLGNDHDVADHAGWLLRAGTIDKPRYVVVLDLYANPGLRAAVLACDIGSRITAAGAPAKHVGPDNLDLIVEGEIHTLGADGWTVAFWCEPYDIYDLGTYQDDTLDANAKRYDSDTTQLIAAVDDNDTALSVDVGHGSRWTLAPSSLDAKVGGERVTVTAVANAAPSLIGVGTAAHADNAAVAPTFHASTAVGDSVWCVAGARGVGTLSITSGWALFANHGGFYVWRRDYTAGLADPTVTPAGGSAGDTVSAIVMTWRGLSGMCQRRSHQTNASAQDIAFPAITSDIDSVVIFLLARKSDDWTSVAPPGSFLEIAEPDSTAGSDQGLYLAYQYQSIASIVSASTVVVTGGGSAVSDVIMLAVPSATQTLTVTRSVNDVVKSHAARAQVRVWDGGIYTL